MTTKKSFEVKLFNYDSDMSKEWYVGFRMECPKTGKRKPFQIRLGINYEKKLQERLKVGKSVKDLVEHCLHVGWDPFSQDLDMFIKHLQTSEMEKELEEQKRQEEEEKRKAEEAERLGLVNCLNRAYDNRKSSFSRKSKLDIACVLRFAIAAAVTLGIDKMSIHDVRKSTVKAILDQMAIDRQAEYDRQARLGKKQRTFTGNSYNKYKSYLSILFTDISDDDLTEYNPCAKIKTRRKIKTNIHRHATVEEKQLIVDTLKSKDYRFYKFLSTLHASGVRIDELMCFRIGDIDHVNKALRMHYSNAKTAESRIVPLPIFAYNYIAEMTDGYPDHFFIFNTNFKPGCYVRVRPGDHATRRWKKIVKDDLGLTVTLYSFKGLGGEDKRKAGVSKGAVSAGYGHSSLNMTDIYLHGEQDRINAEIREKSPEL